MNEVAKKMLAKSKNSRLEKFGKSIDLCLSDFDCLYRSYDFDFVAQKGLSTFFVNEVNIFSFLFGPNLESFR